MYSLPLNYQSISITVNLPRLPRPEVSICSWQELKSNYSLTVFWSLYDLVFSNSPQSYHVGLDSGFSRLKISVCNGIDHFRWFTLRSPPQRRSETHVQYWTEKYKRFLHWVQGSVRRINVADCWLSFSVDWMLLHSMEDNSAINFYEFFFGLNMQDTAVRSSKSYLHSVRNSHSAT